MKTNNAWSMPANACDSHMHVFSPGFPIAPGAEPLPEASVAQYRAVQLRLGTSRSVVVAPSTYGLDNRCTLKALVELGSRARAVVALPPEVANSELERLHGLGVRGVRLNLARGTSTPFSSLHSLVRSVCAFGWHVQLMMTPAQLREHGDELLRIAGGSDVKLVIDHMARLAQDGGLESSAYPVLLRLIDTGRAWVKLSLASSAQLLDTDREEVLHTLGRKLVEVASGRLVWGSDWPHVISTLENKPQPDDVRMRDILLDWAPTARDRQAILVDTPAALYDFGLD